MPSCRALLCVRAFDRLGKGVRSPPRDALVADLVEPRQRGRAFGYIRGLDHAGAAIASNYLVTLFRSAAALVTEAGAPAEALVPLLERTIANGFDLTGPIARGDMATVTRHEEAIEHSEHPELGEMYRVLALLTKEQQAAR